MIIDDEKEKYIRWAFEDATPPTRRCHPQRVAALLLADDLRKANPPYKREYSVTVENWTVTVTFSSAALIEQHDVQQLIDELNAS